MATVLPFRALRPTPEAAKQVASPPYDVLNSDEARTAAAGNPQSFLHVTKSEIDLPAGTPLYNQEVYAKAKANLDSLISKGILFRDEKPAYYIYRLVMKGREQTGLVGLSSINDYEKNIIKKHEFTRPEKEQDRINHIKTTGAQTGNVFLAYRNVAEIDSLISDWKEKHEPIYHFAADDGVQHTIWLVDDEETIKNIIDLFAKKVPFTYIADGHHRAASAAKVKKGLGKKVPQGANYFLTTLFPSNQLRILDYNRVVKDLDGLDAEDLVSDLHDDFDVTLMGREAYIPEKLHDFGMYLNGQWYKLTARRDSYGDDPIGVLDVTILSTNVLDKVLGIRDQRTDKRIDFVGGIRGLSELEKRVKSS